ncbi:hypothetical protein U1Q18_031260 [Sarracenia purpurea var. burkii]
MATPLTSFGHDSNKFKVSKLSKGQHAVGSHEGLETDGESSDIVEWTRIRKRMRVKKDRRREKQPKM